MGKLSFITRLFKRNKNIDYSTMPRTCNSHEWEVVMPGINESVYMCVHCNRVDKQPSYSYFLSEKEQEIMYRSLEQSLRIFRDDPCTNCHHYSLYEKKDYSDTKGDLVIIECQTCNDKWYRYDHYSR